MTRHHRSRPKGPLSLEHKVESPATRGQFLRRLAGFASIVFVILVAALGIGVCGYHFLGELPWIDALVNASMILGGMGPVDQMKTTSAKLFAAFYALFSGLVFVASFSVLMTPIMHRVLHKFHADGDDLPQ